MSPWDGPERRAFGRARGFRGRIVDPSQGLDGPGVLVVQGGRVVSCGPLAPGVAPPDTVDLGSLVIAPGFVDLRVFTGEPGARHRETIRSAGEAAVAGGVTSLLVMPDTEPPIDEPSLVEFVSRTGEAASPARVHPAGALTRGLEGRDMAELRLMHRSGALAFTDGRRDVADSGLVRRLMSYTRDFDGLYMTTNRDAALAGGGVVNEGRVATRMGLAGVPKEAEIVALERDLRLVRLTGARYHAATVSTAEGIDLVRRAKGDGLPVSCSVPVTHATLNENDVDGYRTFFKLSPPLRHEDDRQAVIEGLADGTVDALVSAHDPQDVDTKRLPFAEAADGAIGLETLFAAAMRLVHDDRLALGRAIELLSAGPARVLGVDTGTLAPGAPADFAVLDPDEPWQLREGDLRSRSKNTPFENARFSGRVRATYVAGREAFAHKVP